MTQADLNDLKVYIGENRRFHCSRFHCTATSSLWHINTYPVNMHNGRFEPFIADGNRNRMLFGDINIEFALAAKFERADCHHQY